MQGIFLKTKYWIFIPIFSVSGWLLITCTPIGFNHEYVSFSSNTPNPSKSFSEEKSFHSLIKQAGCEDFNFYVWNYIYQIVSIEGGKPPPYYAVKEKIIRRVQKEIKTRQVPEEAISNFAKQFVKIYAYITEFMQEQKANKATEILVQLEHESIPSKYYALANKLHLAFTELDRHAKKLNRRCTTPPVLSQFNPASSPSTKQSVPLFESLKRVYHPMIYGALKVMSTAYQSCTSILLPLMPTGYETQGVHVYASHPSNPSGYLREIYNPQAVIQSHYYISQIQGTNSNFCFNIQARPMIYDFGGKPAPYKTSLHLFKNSGGGAPVLGIDCSGFVATAMATAGLRFKHNMPIRPIHVQGINAGMFKNAQHHKLSCLEKQNISLQNSLQSGDIIASNYHVAIVDQIGEDPFHIHTMHSVDECHFTKLNIENFNFSIIQSSAHNTVGINRMHISQAFDTQSDFGRGLQKIASKLCYQKFGMAYPADHNEITIHRHLWTQPACRNKEIHLEYQECLNKCALRDS